MNILILTTCLSSGGAERVAAELSNGLSKRHDVSLCVFSTEEGIDYDYTGELFNLGINMSAHSLRKLASLQFRLPQLKNIKQTQNVDVTISLLNGPNIANLLTHADDRKIISIRNCITRKFSGIKNLPRRTLIRLLYARADYAVPVSEGVKYNAIKHRYIRSKNARTIYNPVNIEHIETRVNAGLPDKYQNIMDSRTLINVGRLTKQKGHLHLLRIFKKVKHELPETKLLLLGKGDIRQKLENLSQQLDLKTNRMEQKIQPGFDVYFLGYQPDPFPWIAEASCFVFPSLWEGLPNVLIESMACGTPVVSSDCHYGPREILAPNTHFRLSTDNPEEAEYGMLLPDFHISSGTETSRMYDIWTNALTSLLKNETLQRRYVRKGKNRAEAFRSSEIISKWEDLLSRQ